MSWKLEMVKTIVIAMLPSSSPCSAYESAVAVVSVCDSAVLCSAHQPRLSPGQGAAPVSPVSRGQAARTPTHSYSPAHSVTRASASPASTLSKLEARRPQPPLSPAAAPHTNGGQQRLGSPFWCGLGSRDPQSRTFEFPERDVPVTSPAATPAPAPATYKHVTNLLIDKGGAGGPDPALSPSGYNLHLPVPALDTAANIQVRREHSFVKIPQLSPSPCDQKPQLSSDNEEEEDGSCGEAEGVKQQGARSSFIKYNSANSKLKPKRKIVNHLNKASCPENELL